MTRSDFSDTIRRAAGHAPALVPDEEPPVAGSIGVGVGGAAGGRQPRPVANEQINGVLRQAVAIKTGRIPAGAHDVNLDDLFGS